MTSRRLLALGLLAVLSACQSGPQTAYQPLPNRGVQAASVGNRADWFSALPPALQSYYAEARGKTGADLFNTLSVIVTRNHHPLDYGAARAYMYGVADNFAVNGRTGVVDVYSNLFIPGSGGNGNSYRESGDENKDGTAGDFINCEHTWPQSFFNKALPMVSDMHHLFPTLSKPNGMRSHFPFGTASEGRVSYSTASGSHLVVRSGRINANFVQEPDKEVTAFGGTDSVFEPDNHQKGNTARGLQYFYLRYHGQNIKSGEYSPEFWVKRVSMFRQWSEQIDPVDDRERTRDELVFQKQGNRNPFIDIPNLASIIGDDVMAQ